jgi:hypothetical protein
MLVRAAVAPLLAEPRISSEQQSQLLRGQPFTELERHAEWMRVVAEDGYTGWLHRGYAMSAHDGSPDGEIAGFSTGCIVESKGEKLALPFGALSFAHDRLLGGEIITSAERNSRFPPQADAIIRTALTYYRGAPYLWGGVTPWGADCSGFIQNIFRAHNILLARDSGAQAMQGRQSQGSPVDSEAAELLFFSDREDGRITHVGLSLGEGRMAHVALGRGGFAVENFSSASGSDPYVDELKSRFRFARRVL